MMERKIAACLIKIILIYHKNTLTTLQMTYLLSQHSKLLFISFEFFEAVLICEDFLQFIEINEKERHSNLIIPNKSYS